MKLTSSLVTHTPSAVLLLITMVASTLPAYAQLNLPTIPSEANTRFFSDAFNVKRPSLSFNGFDSGSSTVIGRGLRQVLELVYSASPPAREQDLYSQVVVLASQPIAPATSYQQARANSERLAAKSFVALASYIIFRAGYPPNTLQPSLPLPDVALQDLRTSFLTFSAWKVDEYEKDAMKWATPLSNVARAIDLYLALENAHRFYNEADYANELSTTLLSRTEKDLVLKELHLSMWRVEQLGGEGAEDILQSLGAFFGINAYEVQAGNWPLKVQVALGYAALAQQTHQQLAGMQLDYRALLKRAFNAAGAPSAGERSAYWNYQTDDGQRFWAEGAYYFHLTLSQVVPFWHAARINGLLSDNTLVAYPIGDPFNSAWFTEPLHWLADVVTPEGATPPLDDGNKHVMYNSFLLEWSGSFGDPDLGAKFRWVTDRNGPTVNPGLLTVGLSIPRVSASASSSPVSNVGNVLPGQTGDDFEQLALIRRPSADGACSDLNDEDGHCHFLLLNGESGDAIARGEGHEQPDQLQLLYYVDNVSYLVDSGYDKASPFANSRWNWYQDHSVMQMYPDWHATWPERPNDGIAGAAAPQLSLSAKRKVANHQHVDDIYRSQHGNLTVLHGRMPLKTADLGGYLYTSGWYRRTVIFVGGSSDPYIIDFNMAGQPSPIDSKSPQGYQLLMSYHGNGPTVSPNPSQSEYTVWRNVGGSGGDLFIFPGDVEQDVLRSATYMLHEDTHGEDYSHTQATTDLLRLDIQAHDEPGEDFLLPYHTTAAFIKAFPDGYVGGPDHPIPQQWDTSPVPAGTDRGMQAWTWQIDTGTLDVFVARSSMHYTYSSIQPRYDLDFELQNAGSVVVQLPAAEDYGFVRLRNEAGTWIPVEGYDLNVTLRYPPSPPDPLSVSISGPTNLNYVQTGTWTASVSGGTAPFSYLWEKCEEAFAASYSMESMTAPDTTYPGGDQTQPDSSKAKGKRPKNGSESPATGDPVVQVTPNCSPFVTVGTGASLTYTPSSSSTRLNLQLTVSDSGSPAQVKVVGVEVSVNQPTMDTPTYYSPAPAATGLPTSIYFDWSTVSGASGYVLRVNPNSASATEYHVSSSSATRTVPECDRIWWQVRAKDASGNLGQWAPSWYFETACPVVLVPPVLSSPANGATGVPNPVYFSWGSVLGANRYILRVAPNCGSATEYTVYNTAVSRTVANCKIWWQARAVDVNGNLGPWASSRYFWPSSGGALQTADIMSGDSSSVQMGKTLANAQSVSLNDASIALPTDYLLEGNYPNPFNPITKIRFGLPEAAPVLIMVYDVSGRAIDVLVRGILSAGYHEIEFNGSSLPSGVYFYRMTSGSYTKTMHTVLLK